MRYLYNNSLTFCLAADKAGTQKVLSKACKDYRRGYENLKKYGALQVICNAVYLRQYRTINGIALRKEHYERNS